MQWVVTDKVDLAKVVDAPALAQPAPDDVAFLQFTSGSTSDPKGVMVSTRCAVANVCALFRCNDDELRKNWRALCIAGRLAARSVSRSGN